MKRETRWIERGGSVICSFHDRNGRLVKAISPNVYAAHGAGFAYTFDLSDVEYEDESTESDKKKPETVEKTVDGVSKQFIKGERLKYYPAGMNLYSSSRGMKKPVVEEMTNAEAMERVGDSELVYRETYAIGDKDKGNLIDKRYYKKKDL